MDLIPLALGALAWIILRISVAEALISRYLGLSRRYFGNTFLRLTRHGITFRQYVQWCEPVTELSLRMMRLSVLHLWVQASALLLALCCTLFLWNVGPDRNSGVYFLSLTIIEAVWLFANLFDFEGGMMHEIKHNRQNGADYAPLAAYVLLERCHQDERPRAWPMDLVEALNLPEQSPATSSLTSAMRYTWANDVADAEAKRSAAIDMESALRDLSVPQEHRSYTAALYAFHLITENREDESLAWLNEAEKHRASCENWLNVGSAWLDVRNGNSQAAKQKLDAVWRSVATGSDLSAYALEHCRRIMPDYEPPS